jgi:hypothetical protein
MTKGGTGRVRTLSVIIQWSEDQGEEIYISHCINNEAKETVSKADAKYGGGTNRRHFSSQGSSKPDTRLRPTDRLILNALRARLHENGQVTAPVTTKELMEECSISRRQVQICLRRLSERGWIERLQAGGNFGNQEGFRYQLPKMGV